MQDRPSCEQQLLSLRVTIPAVKYITYYCTIFFSRLRMTDTCIHYYTLSSPRGVMEIRTEVANCILPIPSLPRTAALLSIMALVTFQTDGRLCVIGFIQQYYKARAVFSFTCLFSDRKHFLGSKKYSSKRFIGT